jgi:hypothetical protein
MKAVFGKPKKCKHKLAPWRIAGSDRGFVTGVAVHPHTRQEPRAHGGIVYRERCPECRATRRVATNGRYREYSPWSADEGDTT